MTNKQKLIEWMIQFPFLSFSLSFFLSFFSFFTCKKKWQFLLLLFLQWRRRRRRGSGVPSEFQNKRERKKNRHLNNKKMITTQTKQQKKTRRLCDFSFSNLVPFFFYELIINFCFVYAFLSPPSLPPPPPPPTPPPLIIWKLFNDETLRNLSSLLCDINSCNCFRLTMKKIIQPFFPLPPCSFFGGVGGGGWGWEWFISEFLFVAFYCTIFLSFPPRLSIFLSFLPSFLSHLFQNELDPVLYWQFRVGSIIKKKKKKKKKRKLEDTTTKRI